MSESDPSQAPSEAPETPQPVRPVRGSAWMTVLKLALFIGAVLFLQHVVLPRLGVFT